MNDSTSTTTEPTLPNDTAARSTTGEILDVRDQPTPKPTESGTTSTPETTPEPSTPTETKTTETKPTEPSKAPETYEAFKAPEGLALDPKAIEAAVPIFKELGLTQDQAQKLVDAQVKLQSAANEAYNELRTDWRNKTQADADLKAATSGDKTGLDAVKLDIGKALDAIGDPSLVKDFRAAMDLTGAGDHPAFVKALWRLAQFATEGKHVAGGGPSPGGQRAPDAKPASAAKALYPNLA